MREVTTLIYSVDRANEKLRKTEMLLIDSLTRMYRAYKILHNPPSAQWQMLNVEDILKRWDELRKS